MGLKGSCSCTRLQSTSRSNQLMTIPPSAPHFHHLNLHFSMRHARHSYACVSVPFWGRLHFGRNTPSVGAQTFPEKSNHLQLPFPVFRSSWHQLLHSLIIVSAQAQRGESCRQKVTHHVTAFASRLSKSILLYIHSSFNFRISSS